MLHELLGIEKSDKQVVSIYGGGGKTSLLYALARERCPESKTAIYTTTNIFVPEEPDITLLEPFESAAALEVWGRKGIVCAGTYIPEKNKLGPPSAEAVCWLQENAQALYVEADGAKRLPLKFPAAWEPVPAEGSTHCIVVAGLSALDQPREAVVHRAALAEREAEYTEPIVSEDGMAALLWAGYGRFDPVFLLNQADAPELEQRGQRIAELLIGKGARRVVVLSLKNLYG